MMHSANLRSALQPVMEDTSLLRKQLQREINCLRTQLERLHRRDEYLDLITLQTYEEMISSREDMLNSLSL